MSLQGGTVAVTLDSDGSPQYVGSGLALAWARATIDALLPRLPPLPTIGSTAAPFRSERPVTQADRDTFAAARRLLFEDKARDANAIAPVLVAYLQNNATIALQGVIAQVTVSVGRTPTPNDPGSSIAPPLTPVSLPLIGNGTLQ